VLAFVKVKWYEHIVGHRIFWPLDAAKIYPSYSLVNLHNVVVQHHTI